MAYAKVVVYVALDFFKFHYFCCWEKKVLEGRGGYSVYPQGWHVCSLGNSKAKEEANF